jgi:pyrimidine-specific ribonucleoside hydrolase
MKNIWIDTDLSVGMLRTKRADYCDVDDGFAVLQLMKSDRVRIMGMSAVFGNTDIDSAYRLCNHMVDHFSSYPIPVYKGAGTHMDLNLIQTNEAIDALYLALLETPMIIMAIGPATNIGLLLTKYPTIASQIQEVILVAGRRKPTDRFNIGNKGGVAQDLNFDLDNDAFQLLLQSGVPTTLCPFEISSKVWVDGHDIAMLGKGDEGSKWLAEHSKPWNQQWLDQGASGFNPFDVLASHYILQPEDIIFEPLNARLELYEDDTKPDNDKSIFKNYLICDQSFGYSVRYCHDVVADYHDKLMNTFKHRI